MISLIYFQLFCSTSSDHGVCANKLGRVIIHNDVKLPTLSCKSNFDFLKFLRLFSMQSCRNGSNKATFFSYSDVLIFRIYCLKIPL